MKIIKIRCIEKNMTYKELAKQIGTTEQTIINWANGRTPQNVKTFIRLCEILEININDIKK